MGMGTNDIPAFPFQFKNVEGSGIQIGMTLRDYFAGQAMIGLFNTYANDQTKDELVTMSYQMADAMLLQRTKK